MSFKLILKNAEKYAKELMKKDPKRISDESSFWNSLPTESGIYLIYKNQQVIYVGLSSNIRNRIKQHLSTDPIIKRSAFRRKLKSKCDIKPEQTREWIMKNCRISCIEIKGSGINDSDMCRLVEGLLIAHLRGKYLLNS